MAKEFFGYCGHGGEERLFVGEYVIGNIRLVMVYESLYRSRVLILMNNIYPVLLAGIQGKGGGRG